MLKEITFQCEICKDKFDNESDAIKCEAKGIFDPSAYPHGLMYAEFTNNKFKGIFAIPSTPEPRTSYSHVGYSDYWCCYEDTEQVVHYDSIKKILRGGGDYLYSDSEAVKRWKALRHIPKEYVGNKQFNCMVEFLKAEGISPSYYDEQGILNIVK